MQYLIDGMNVIGSRPNGWWRDRHGAQRALTDRLVHWARHAGAEVVVVFDGKPPREGGSAVELEGQGWKVRVLYAPGGRDAADHVVADLVVGRDEGELTVVTSDVALAQQVAASGAVVMGARHFERSLP